MESLTNLCSAKEWQTSNWLRQKLAVKKTCQQRPKKEVARCAPGCHLVPGRYRQALFQPYQRTDLAPDPGHYPAIQVTGTEPASEQAVRAQEHLLGNASTALFPALILVRRNHHKGLRARTARAAVTGP